MSDLPFLWGARQNALTPEELGFGSNQSAAARAATHATAVQAAQATQAAQAAQAAQTAAHLPRDLVPENVTSPEPERVSSTIQVPIANESAKSERTSLPPTSALVEPKITAETTQSERNATLPTPGLASSVSAASKSASGCWNGELIVASRLHFNEAQKEDIDINKLGAFLRSALSISNDVVIAVGASQETIVKLQQLVTAVQKTCQSSTAQVHILPVSPWGKFIPALNALVSFAANHNFKYICFQSLEVTVAPEVVRCLTAQFELGDTLVAGAAFPKDHLFEPGWRVLNGRTSPWNTLAVWSLNKLALTGFSLVAEGLPMEGIPAGVEEVSTISILQRILPRQAKAKLILHPSLLRSNSWNAEFSDHARQEWHRKKMQSKIDRPAAQLDALGIDPGIVQHISIEP